MYSEWGFLCPRRQHTRALPKARSCPADDPAAEAGAEAPSPGAPRSPALQRAVHLRPFLAGRAGGETGPALQFWALRPPRGAGWRARRCWPSRCGSAWRLGLPLWVRSPLPRREAERPGAGGQRGMRRGPGEPDLPGISELTSGKGPDTLCSFMCPRGSATGPRFPLKLVVGLQSPAPFPRLWSGTGAAAGATLGLPGGAGAGGRPRLAGRPEMLRRREKQWEEVPRSHHPCSRAGKGAWEGAPCTQLLPLEEPSGDRVCASLLAGTQHSLWQKGSVSRPPCLGAGTPKREGGTSGLGFGTLTAPQSASK